MGLQTNVTSISCNRWTRTTICLPRIVLEAYADAYCDKLRGQARRSTVASIVNLIQQAT